MMYQLSSYTNRMMNDLSQISGLFLLIIQNLFRFFSLTRSVSFSWFDYNLSFAHVPSDWVKIDKSQTFNKRSFFLALLLMIKNYDISFKILRVIWRIKRKKKRLLWKSPGTNLYTKSWRVWSSLQTQKRS